MTLSYATLDRSPRPTFLVSETIALEGSAPLQERSFQVRWQINPHMRLGQVSPTEASAQHGKFVTELRRLGADVLTVPFLTGLYDSVFVKDPFILKSTAGGRAALLADFRYKERRAECERRMGCLLDLGVESFAFSRAPFEGGDLVRLPGRRLAFLGYGLRSDAAATRCLEHFLEVDVVPLELVNPMLYHLDMALAALEDGTVLACREAFTDASWDTLVSHLEGDQLIEVALDSALRFGLNLIELGNTVVTASPDVMTSNLLRSLGKTVVRVDLSNFHRAGGSAACLVSRIVECRPTQSQSIRRVNERRHRGQAFDFSVGRVQ